MNLEEMVKSVKEADGTAVKQALRRWDQVAKPLNSLGVLEEDIVRIAGASGTAAVDIGKKAIVVMCADNGIVEEGVTQTGQEVTAIVAGNMAKGCSCVCIMARKAGADVIPIDVGIAGHDSIPGLLPRKVAGGTRNFLKGPSMSRGQALKAMEAGIRTAFELKEKGYGLAGSGEMGIGNTTTSSAVLSVLLDQEPEKVTGRGAGLTTDGYSRKIQVIKDGIALHCPDRTDPVDVLAKVGGFDLAALAGFYRMRYGTPAGGAGRPDYRCGSPGSSWNLPQGQGLFAGIPCFGRACRGNGAGGPGAPPCHPGRNVSGRGDGCGSAFPPS